MAIQVSATATTQPRTKNFKTNTKRKTKSNNKTLKQNGKNRLRKRPTYRANRILWKQQQTMSKYPRKQLFAGNQAGRIVANPYYMCRLHPFNSMGKSNGIPDGSEVRKLLVDHRMSNTITFGNSGTINIMITPCIPSAVWVNSAGTGNFKIDGIDFVSNTNNSVFYVPINFPEWNNQTITYNNAANIYNNAHPLFDANKFRIVSVGWSITFISAAINATGVIRATPVNPAFQKPNPSVGAVTVFSSIDPNGTVYNTNQVLTRSLDRLFDNTAINRFSRIFPLAQGANGILKHSGQNYEYQTIYADHCIPTLASSSQLNDTQSFLLNRYQLPGSFLNGMGIQGVDENWDYTSINITGGTPGQSILLDTIYCLEYCPMPGSSTFPLTTASPRLNQPVLNRAKADADSAPVANSGGISTAVSTINTAINVAKAVGSIIA